MVPRIWLGTKPGGRRYDTAVCGSDQRDVEAGQSVRGFHGRSESVGTCV